MAKVSKLNKKELKQLNTIKKAYSYNNGSNSQIVLYKNKGDLKYIYHIINKDAWSMVYVTEAIYERLHKKGKKRIIIQDDQIGQFSFYPSDDKRDIFRKLSTIVEYYKL